MGRLITIEGLDDLNAFKIPASFLWSIDSAPTDTSVNSIGGVMVVVGIVIVLMAFVRNQAARRIAGAVAAFFCLDYAIEVLRSLNESPGAPGIFSVLGFGQNTEFDGRHGVLKEELREHYDKHGVTGPPETTARNKP